jgi:hypothetical protein
MGHEKILQHAIFIARFIPGIVHEQPINNEPDLTYNYFFILDGLYGKTTYRILNEDYVS